MMKCSLGERPCRPGLCQGRYSRTRLVNLPECRRGPSLSAADRVRLPITYFRGAIRNPVGQLPRFQSLEDCALADSQRLSTLIRIPVFSRHRTGSVNPEFFGSSQNSPEVSPMGKRMPMSAWASWTTSRSSRHLDSQTSEKRQGHNYASLDFGLCAIFLLVTTTQELREV